MKNLFLLFLPFILFGQDFSQLLHKASKGDKDAQIKVAKYYESTKNSSDALFWYKKAALNQKESKSLPQIKNGFDKKLVSSVTNEIQDNHTKDSLLQILTSNFGLYPYKSNYIMPITYDFNQKQNRKKQETFFQLSFLIPLSKNYFAFDETINLGYTQQSWWQTFKDSAPFRETNYQPEIFVNLPTEFKNIASLKMLRFGVLHNSNGQSGSNSRSLNALYLKSFFQYQNLFINLKNWYRIPESEKDFPQDPSGDDNPDYIDYYGDGEIEIQYYHAKHILSGKYRYAFSHLNKGAFTLGWSFPINENLFGYINYIHGYAESLIDYNKKVKRVGFGIQFTR